jgi:hypothetical protein
MTPVEARRVRCYAFARVHSACPPPQKIATSTRRVVIRHPTRPAHPRAGLSHGRSSPIPVDSAAPSPLRRHCSFVAVWRTTGVHPPPADLHSLQFSRNIPSMLFFVESRPRSYPLGVRVSCAPFAKNRVQAAHPTKNNYSERGAAGTRRMAPGHHVAGASALTFQGSPVEVRTPTCRAARARGSDDS